MGIRDTSQYSNCIHVSLPYSFSLCPSHSQDALRDARTRLYVSKVMSRPFLWSIMGSNVCVWCEWDQLSGGTCTDFWWSSFLHTYALRSYNKRQTYCITTGAAAFSHCSLLPVKLRHVNNKLRSSLFTVSCSEAQKPLLPAECIYLFNISLI